MLHSQMLLISVIVDLFTDATNKKGMVTEPLTVRNIWEKISIRQLCACIYQPYAYAEDLG